MPDVDYLSLFSGDDAAAQNQAAALAQAIRRRRSLGELGSIVGGPFEGAGKQFSGDADKLESGLIGAAQHRAQQQLQREHFAAQDKMWGDLAEHRRTQDQLAAVRTLLAGVKRVPVRDAWGNTTLQPQIDGATAARISSLLGGEQGATAVLPGAAAAAGGVTPAPRQPKPKPAAPSPAPASAGAGPAAPAAPGAIPPAKVPQGANMTPEAFDQAAEQAYRTGKFGNYGRATGLMTTALRERIAQLHPGADLASTSGAYEADKRSLANQQKLLDLTKSWEETGKANLGVLRQKTAEMVNAGSPLLNRPLRWLYENAAGDPSVVAFKAAHNAVVNEYAKILSGATGGGGVTEGARHEAEAMLPMTSTPEQIAAAADVLEKDAGNRLSALTRGVESTRERMGAKPSAGGEGTPIVRKFKRVNGKLVEDK